MESARQDRCDRTWNTGVIEGKVQCFQKYSQLTRFLRSGCWWSASMFDGRSERTWFSTRLLVGARGWPLRACDMRSSRIITDKLKYYKINEAFCWWMYWLDINRSTFDRDESRKRSSPFRSQWPWPFTLWPQNCFPCYSYPVLYFHWIRSF